MRVHGGVVRIKPYGSGGPERPAGPGTVVHRGDIVHTYGASVLLRFLDGTELLVGSDSFLMISPPLQYLRG